MVEAMIYQKDYQASQIFQQRYNESIQILQNQSRRNRRDDMQTPASPAGADNPITPGN